MIAIHAIYKFKIRQTVADISRISQFHVLFNLHTVHTYFLAEVLPFGPTVRLIVVVGAVADFKGRETSTSSLVFVPRARGLYRSNP